MEELLKNPLGVGLALVFLLELFNLVTRVAQNIRVWRKPGKTVEERLASHDRMLDNDNQRIDSLNAGQVVIIMGVKALINHERTGNSVDKLAEALEDIDKYLVKKK